MKIILIGATGTIGKKVFEELSVRHQVISASPNNSEHKADLGNSSSISDLYRKTGSFDAVVCCAGKAHFGSFERMNEDDFYIGIKNKLMGQINLVMLGKDLINNEGSFTLISGVTADDPVSGSAGLSMTNGALNAFVLAASRELKRGIRINIVSPGLVEDSVATLGARFPGHYPVSMERVVTAFVKSVEGNINGQILRAY